MTEQPNGQVAAPPAPAGDGEPAEKECVWCERMPGAVAVFAALVIGYIGADLLTGGAVSRFLFRAGVSAPEESPGDGSA